MSNLFLNSLSAMTTMDLSATANIIFVGVAAALCVLFIALIVSVVLRGKRKPSAFDVIVRVIASVVIVASVVLLAASFLCRMDGDVYIDASVPALIINQTMRELPLPVELFVALKTMLGAILVLAVLLLAFVALICDCLMANKKKGDAEDSAKAKKPTKVQKTPDELKREAELARINRLANSVTKKTANAPAATPTTTKEKPTKEKPVKDKHAKEKEQPAKENETPVTAPSASEPPKTEQPIEEKPTAEPPVEDGNEFDWRIAQPQKPASFVGIKENRNDGFDTFNDSFDDDFGVDTPDENDGAEEQFGDATENVEEEAFDSGVNDFTEDVTEDMSDDSVETDEFGGSNETEEEAQDEYEPVESFDEEEQDEYEPAESSDEEVQDEYEPVESFDEEAQDEYEPAESSDEVVEEKVDDLDVDAEEDVVPVEEGDNFDVDNTASEVYDEYDDEYDDEFGDEIDDDDDDNEDEEFDAVEPTVVIAGGRTPRSRYAEPQVKFVTKKDTSPAAKNAAQEYEEKSAKVNTAVQTAEQKAAELRAQRAAEKAQRKAAEKTPVNTSPERSESKRPGSPTRNMPKARNITVDKHVATRATRRYVILDSTSASDSFSEYLRSKNGSDKDKLESSISKINLK
ncbi:MAG: hypothetical protein J1G04_04570 [Clostridiales bacterium]|nr:hypothetical protein [Clostridiales bacterium]